MRKAPVLRGKDAERFLRKEKEIYQKLEKRINDERNKLEDIKGQ